MLPTLKRLTPYLKLAAGLALLLVLVFWVDWPATWGYLQTADPRWLLLGGGLQFVLLTIKTVRSGLLLLLVGVRLTRWLDTFRR